MNRNSREELFLVSYLSRIRIECLQIERFERYYSSNDDNNDDDDDDYGYDERRDELMSNFYDDEDLHHVLFVIDSIRWMYIPFLLSY